MQIFQFSATSNRWNFAKCEIIRNFWLIFLYMTLQ